jgi:hypothetical protein
VPAAHRVRFAWFWRASDPQLSPQIPYQIEIVQLPSGTFSIGSAICNRAEQLNAVCVVMAKGNKGQVEEFFVGSVCSHCECAGAERGGGIQALDALLHLFLVQDLT